MAAQFSLGKAYRLADKRQSAADVYSNLLDSEQSEFSRLWIAHLKIEATFEKDSPSYQKEIHEFLENSSDTVDDYKNSLKQNLALSYFRTKNYPMASEIFAELVGKDPSDNVNAYNFFLLAKSYFKEGKIVLANNLMKDLMSKYPETGSAKLAEEHLDIFKKQYMPNLDFEDELQEIPPGEITSATKPETKIDSADATPSPRDQKISNQFFLTANTQTKGIIIVFSVIFCVGVFFIIRSKGKIDG